MRSWIENYSMKPIDEMTIEEMRKEIEERIMMCTDEKLLRMIEARLREESALETGAVS